MMPRIDTEDRNMTREDFEYEIQKQTLNELRPFLVKNLQPERLFPWLQSKNILSLDDCEYISSMVTTNRKVNVLVDTLTTVAGPMAFKQFVKSIENYSKTQKFVSERLNNAFHDLMNKRENQQKLEYIERWRRHPTPPPPYTDTPQRQAEKRESRPEQPGRRVSSPNDHLRTPVEWPRSGADPTEGDSCLSSQQFEHDTREGLSTFRVGDSLSDYSTNGDRPLYLSEQDEKMSLYINSGQAASLLNTPVQEPKPRAFSNPELHSVGFPSSRPATGGAMASVIDDQSVEFEKCKLQMLRLGGRRTSQPRSRSPNEHDFSVTSSTELKQLRLPPDLPEANSSESNVVNLPSSQPLTSPGSEESSIGIFRPPDDASFEISAGSLFLPPTQ